MPGTASERTALRRTHLDKGVPPRATSENTCLYLNVADEDLSEWLLSANWGNRFLTSRLGNILNSRSGGLCHSTWHHVCGGGHRGGAGRPHDAGDQSRQVANRVERVFQPDTAGERSRSSLIHVAHFAQQDIVIQIDANGTANGNCRFGDQAHSMPGNIHHTGRQVCIGATRRATENRKRHQLVGFESVISSLGHELLIGLRRMDMRRFVTSKR
jgi:hypothetical protein